VTLPPPTEWPVDDPLPDESADLLHERATATPDATAIVDTDRERTWSYAEFDHRVDEWCAGLARHVDPKGRRIAVLLPTGIEFATAYFAIARRNGVVVPLNLRESDNVVERQVKQAAVDVTLCTSETERMARSVTPTDAHVLSIDETDASDVTAFEPGDPSTDLATTAGIDTDRLVLFTSGTTGDPKGVRLTRGNLLESAVGSAKRLGVETGDRWFVCLPMYHMGGLAPLVRSTLYGTTTVLQREFDARESARELAAARVTGVSLAPTMLRRLLDEEWVPPESLQFVLLGGAPARPALIERCAALDVPVYPTYGTTETASQITTATPTEAFANPDTVGRPLDGTSLTLLDDGVECAPEEVGEIVVEGPTVTPGYLDPDQTAAAFDDRGFHTGDVGYRDEAGRYFVVGRVDDQVVTGGENVQPASVARTLESLSSVESAAVVGVPDDEWGQRVAAAVVPAHEGVTPARVRDAARVDLADFAVPKTVRLVDSLPRTASGTIDRETVGDLLSDDG